MSWVVAHPFGTLHPMHPLIESKGHEGPTQRQVPDRPRYLGLSETKMTLEEARQRQLPQMAEAL